MTDKALLVCHCIAERRGLASTGPRSAIGSILVSRNDPWLNAAPTAWSEFSGDNGDIKFPMRTPVLPGRMKYYRSMLSDAVTKATRWS